MFIIHIKTYHLFDWIAMAVNVAHDAVHQLQPDGLSWRWLCTEQTMQLEQNLGLSS